MHYAIRITISFEERPDISFELRLGLAYDRSFYVPIEPNTVEAFLRSRSYELSAVADSVIDGLNQAVSEASSFSLCEMLHECRNGSVSLSPVYTSAAGIECTIYYDFVLYPSPFNAEEFCNKRVLASIFKDSSDSILKDASFNEVEFDVLFEVEVEGEEIEEIENFKLRHIEDGEKHSIIADGVVQVSVFHLHRFGGSIARVLMDILKTNHPTNTFRNIEILHCKILSPGAR